MKAPGRPGVVQEAAPTLVCSKVDRWGTVMTHSRGPTAAAITPSHAHPEHSAMLHDEADEDLMVQYQQGEVRAFEILLGRHRKPVFNFILRYVGDKETAEDLLQETFMRVIKGADAYKRQAKFTTWLYTIARNLCVDQTRRRKHRRHASLDAPMSASEDSGTLLDVLPGSEMASDRKSVNKQLHETMQRAIGSLSEEQREVFLMREFLDMPFKQIAEVVGVPENTVKSRMRYALEKLRLELDEYKDLAKALP
jgi:RNA polymerase sigma-70 factor (ECF subfamily)